MTGDDELRAKAERLMPTQEQLLKLAKDHSPPPEWYDEDFSDLFAANEPENAMTSEYREYMRLTEDRHGDVRLLGSMPGERDAEAILCGPMSGDLTHLTVEDATALRDALTRWLMDVEVNGG